MAGNRFHEFILKQDLQAQQFNFAWFIFLKKIIAAFYPVHLSWVSGGKMKENES